MSEASNITTESAPAHAELNGNAKDSAHRGHGEGRNDESGYAHIVSGRLLVAVFGALVLLTVVTVGVTQYDIGPTGNLVVALVVATAKAALVVAFFMHLVWDKRFHLLLLLTAVLMVLLFIGLSSNDRNEYQPNIDAFQAQAKTTKS